jgi:predicted RNA-binding protein with PIN domain
MSVREWGIVSEDIGGEQAGDGAPMEPTPPPAPAPAPVTRNGFEVADWLIEPLFDAAVNGLETMLRTDVPPRLIPMTGRRHPKISRAQRESILTALGRHEKFTDAAFDRLFEDHEAEASPLEGASVEKIIEMIEQAEADAALTVCLLFATGRPDEAQQVAAWATQKDEASGTLAGIIDALSRENAEARERLRRADQDLAQERRARRALERKIRSATTTADTARAQATKAESRAGWTRVEANADAPPPEALMHELATAQAALEAGRRERRDLLAELRDSEDRYRRARRELREVRARLPVETSTPELELRSEESAPTTVDLRDRFVQSGVRGVLDSKRLLLLVDGWNVSLGHIGAAKLEDKRRVLEQALERYKSRTGNKVMVVYDGRKVSWFWMPRAEGRTIARVFTEGETADDFIVAELEADWGRPDAPVVVTSDRELRKRCIAQGAFVVSSEDLATVLGL